MRILIIFIFLLSFPVSAEDISDFEIEGISIGDSLIELVSKDQILAQFKITSNYYKHLNNPNKFREVYIFSGKDFYNSKEFEIYDDLSFFVKPDDNKYTIHFIRGLITFNENLQECFKIKNEIIQDIESIIPDYKDKRESSTSAQQDSSGRSKAYHTVYILENDDVFHINCNDWEENLRKKNNWTEGLTVSIYTNEFYQWLHDF